MQLLLQVAAKAVRAKFEAREVVRRGEGGDMHHCAERPTAGMLACMATANGWGRVCPKSVSGPGIEGQLWGT